MYEAEDKVMNPEEELIDTLLDFIIVSASLAKKVNQAMKIKQIKEEATSMGKISELEMAITDLRRAATAINEVANSLAEMFSGNETADAPTEDPTPTLEEVRAILAEKSRKGHTAEIRSLLEKYGAAKLSGIDPANYKALLADAEGLKDVT